MGINLRKNKNQNNAGFGKYYPEVDVKTTLSLKGFAKHLVDHGSTYKQDVVEGVLKKITECLPELVSQGVPVQLEPLGTFYPTAKSAKGIALSEMPNVTPDDVVKGIHIRFLPYSVTDEDITSRRFKEDYCTLEFAYIVEARKVNTGSAKPRTVQDKTPFATFMVDNFGSNGSGSNSGSQGGTNTGGGTQGGGTNTGGTNTGGDNTGGNTGGPDDNGYDPELGDGN